MANQERAFSAISCRSLVAVQAQRVLAIDADYHTATLGQSSLPRLGAAAGHED
jgi:hypothetical protein